MRGYLGSPYFGPAKVVKGTVGWGGRGVDFVAFDCTSQDTAAYGHVVDRVLRG